MELKSSSPAFGDFGKVKGYRDGWSIICFVSKTLLTLATFFGCMMGLIKTDTNITENNRIIT
jgi:hypothetical protein